MTPEYQSMTVYAVKQKSTGWYLPKGKVREVMPAKGAPPKLFKYIGNANGARTVWLRGRKDKADDMVVVALALVEVPIPVKI